jgi:ketosteroid isomerase-like protein
VIAVDRFADAFRKAFASGDPAPLVGILAPGAVLWHNNDGVELEAAVACAGVSALAGRVEGLHVDIHEQEGIGDGGYVRFIVRGTVNATGRQLAARNCVFVRFDADGRVTRMDEYVDPTFTEQVIG